MKRATTVIDDLSLALSESFNVTAPSAFSGNMTVALIDRLRLVKADGRTSWRLFGSKVRKDGTLSVVPFEFAPINDSEGRDVWAQIPAEIRDQLPYTQELTERYIDSKTEGSK